MAKLNLLIADTDKAYVDALASYLIDTHPNKFKLSCFTEQKHLIDFLKSDNNVTDILLANPDMIPDMVPKEKVRCCLALTGERINEKLNNYIEINKYQTGENLVSAMLGVYSEQISDRLVLKEKNKKTQVVAIYSPVGGSGKTSIALACSSWCSDNGQKVLYLNFEGISATSLYFENKSDKSLSNIFYLLKENHSNLSLKIQSIKQVDVETGIHFFVPPDSVLEYEELMPEDFKHLLEELKQAGIYDVIFIDMSSAFDNRNIAIFEESDRILTVIPYDEQAEVKAERLLKETDIAFRKYGVDLREKFEFILNKYNVYKDDETQEMNWLEQMAAVKLALDTSLYIRDEGKYILNLKSNFYKEIAHLLQRILKEEKNYD